MPTIDEIFNTMPAEAAVTYEELVIDAKSREIYVPEAEAVFGVESDSGSERKHFRCPRYVGDALDLSACFLRVNFRNANGETDAYLVEDVTVDGEDITFSWELSRKAVTYKGEVQFIVCAITSDGLTEWNTTLAEGKVLEGLEPDTSGVEEATADVIAQLLAVVTKQTAAVEAVGDEQVARVQTAASELIRTRAAVIVCEAEGETVQVNDSSADPLIGLRIFGKSTQDGTPTPEAPVEIVSLKAPVVTVCGRNLIPYPYSDGESKEMNGITFSVREDGSVLVNGTATALAFFNFNPSSNRLPVPAGRLSTSAGIGYGPGIVQIQNDIYQDGVYVTTVQTATEGAATRQFTGNGLTLGTSRIKVDAGVTVNNAIVYPILESTEPAYEKPKARRTFSLSTPTNLPGIPVTSGGNYTDANGQQWIADEVDLARAVRVQRVWRVAGFSLQAPLANTRIYQVKAGHPLQGYSKKGSFCTHTDNYAYNTDDQVHYYIEGDTVNVYLPSSISMAEVDKVEVYCLLSSPIETPLSTEEIEAFKALLANKPTTTVLNDAGAWMALEYAADPKTYIDNKIAALLAAGK